MTDDVRPSLDGIPPRPGGPGRGGRARGQQENAAVRANRAVELRMAGATFTQIADSLGYSDPATARRAIQRALDRDYDRTSDLRDQYRTITLARCERLTRAHWPRAIAGDVHATGIVIKLLERTSKLLGLDAPMAVAIAPASSDHLVSLLDDLRGEQAAHLAERDREIAALERQLALSTGGNGDSPNADEYRNEWE